MSRALVPLTAGAFGGWWWLRDWALHSGFGLLGSSIVLGTHQIWVDQLQSIIIDWSDILSAFWQLSGLVIAWELRVEILYILRQLLILGGYLLGICLWILRQNSGAGNSRLEFEVGSSVELEPWTEQDQSLTCMAAAPAAPYPVGSFLLVSRPPNWDEIWVAGYTNGGGDILGRTTTSDGSQWQWVVVRPVGQSIKIPVTGGDGTRTAPPGVVAGSSQLDLSPTCLRPPMASRCSGSDQLVSGSDQPPGAVGLESSRCDVEYGWGCWRPVTFSGSASIGARRCRRGGQCWKPRGTRAGTGRRRRRFTQCRGSQGLGISSATVAGACFERQRGSQEGQEVQEAPQGFIAQEEEKEKEIQEVQEVPQLHQQQLFNEQSVKEPVRVLDFQRPSQVEGGWQGSACVIQQFDTRRPTEVQEEGGSGGIRGKEPRALTAHFLASVYARLSKGVVDRSGQLRDVSVGAWAQQFTGLTELRDLKEVYTLAEVLDYVNRREVARALDVLCQRILAIQSAKAKNGSWEKAESLELVNSQRSLASSSMLALTNQ